MSRKKQEDTQKDVEAVNAIETSTQDRIKALEAQIAAGEEAALARICRALNINPEEIQKKEQTKKEEKMVRCFVNYPVNINGTVYRGEVTVPYETFSVIQEHLGKRRQRLLSELTGSKWVLLELDGGGPAPKLIEKYDATGERIA